MCIRICTYICTYTYIYENPRDRCIYDIYEQIHMDKYAGVSV